MSKLINTFVPVLRNKKLNKFFILSILLIFLFSVSIAEEEIPGDIRKIIKESENRAIQWLKSQVVPNEVVKLPAPGRRKLILSYSIPQDDPVYKYLAYRSFIYDDAIAILAFTMGGERRYAEGIINTLWRLQRENGSLYFVYNTHNSWPNEQDNEGAIIRTGALAWVGFATVYYLNTMIERNPDFIKKDIIGKRAFELAEKIANFMLSHQVQDKKSNLYGLIKGGYGEYTLSIKDGSLNETFDKTALDWASSEHNIDAYFFLRDFGRLTGKQEYLKAAKNISQGLLKLWSSKDGQFYRGIKGDGEIDKALPLDCASWGAMFLLAEGYEDRLEQTLNTIDHKYTVYKDGLTGYRPYAGGPVYETPKVNDHLSKQLGFNSWDKADIIWVEGNLVVAAAFYKAGYRDKAYSIMSDSLEFQMNGGFIYSDKNIPFQFNTYPSTASTGWFVIVTEITQNANKNRSFWDK